MTLRGFEPAVEAMRTRLADDLPAAIAAINAEVTDGYEIENPQLVLDYVPPLDHMNTFPTVCVANGPGRFEDDNGWSATGVYELVVLAFLQHSDQQTLARQARRYNLALTRAAIDERTLGSGEGIPWSLTVKRIDPGPTLADMDGLAASDPPRAYLTWTALVIEAKLDED